MVDNGVPHCTCPCGKEHSRLGSCCIQSSTGVEHSNADPIDIDVVAVDIEFVMVDN